MFIPLNHYNSLKLYQYYTEPFDTLTTIGQKFEVAMDEIRYFNNLYDYILASSQTLEIEKQANVSPVLVEFDSI
jgi:hypothetical protein